MDSEMVQFTFPRFYVSKDYYYACSLALNTEE